MVLAHWLKGLFPRVRFPHRRPHRGQLKRRPHLGDFASSIGIVHHGETLEDRTLLSTFYVDSSFADLAPGQDPDGAGDATAYGVDAFSSIQEALNAASDGDTIQIAAGVYAENLVITNSVSLIGTTGDPADVTIQAATGAAVTVTGTGSTVGLAGLSITSQSGAAVAVLLNGGEATVTLDSVDASGAGGHGLNVQAFHGSTATIQLTDVSFDDSGFNAVNVNARYGSTVHLVGNGVSGANAAIDGIHIESIHSAVSFSLANVGSFANAGDDAVDVVVRGGAQAAFQFDLSASGASRADFTGAQDNGLILTLNGHQGYSAADPLLEIANLDFSGAGTHGLAVISNGQTPGEASTFNGVVTNTLFNDAGEHGFLAVLSGNSPLSHLRFVDSEMRNAGTDAVRIDASDSTYFSVDIIDGNLTGSGARNVNITQDGGSLVDIFIDPTPLDGGFQFEGENGTVLNAYLLDSPLSTLGNRSEYGVFGTLQTGASMNLVVENSETFAALRDGMHVVATGGSNFNATFINSPIISSSQRGVYLEVDDSTATVQFTQGSRVTGSLASNVQVRATNGGVVSMGFDATSGDLFNAGVDGMYLQSIGKNASDRISAIDVTFAGLANLNNAGRDGLSIISNALGRVNVYANHGLSILNAGDNAISIFGNQSNATVQASNVSLVSQNHAFRASVGNNSRVVSHLTQVATITSQTGDAILFNAGSSFLALTFTGIAGTPMSLVANNGLGVNGTALSNSSVVLKLDQFEIANTASDAIRLLLDNSRLSTSAISNGVISGNGTGHGISLGLSNAASIGTRGAPAFGLAMTNLTLSDSANDGLHIVADQDSYGRMRLTSSTVEGNTGHGIAIDVNPDHSLDDTSLIDLNVGSSNILDNGGDGVNLIARNGASQFNDFASGIIFSFNNGEITGNAGDGIHAEALGNPLGIAANTTILINQLNALIAGNGGGGIVGIATPGGLVAQAITGGEVSDELYLVADGPLASVSLSLNRVKLTSDPNRAGIVMHALNGGFVNGVFSNMNEALNTAITGFGGPAVLFVAETGGVITSSFTNVDMVGNLTNAGFVVEPHTGVNVRGALQGVVQDAGSTATVDFNNVKISGHSLRGFDLNVLNGGEFSSTIRDLTLSNNQSTLAGGEFDVRVHGNDSLATFDIIGLTANGSTGSGINIHAGLGAAGLAFENFRNISANQAAANGLNLIVDGGATLTTPLHIQNATFNGAQGGDGINIAVDTTVAPFAVDISLANLSAHNAAVNGIDIAVTGSAAGGAHSVTMTDVFANNALGGRGLKLSLNGLLTGETAAIDISSATFNQAAVSGIDIQLNGAAGAAGVGSLATVQLEDVTANFAGTAVGTNLFFGNGLDVQQVLLSNVSATNAGTHGLNVRTQGSATRLRELSITGLTNDFSAAGLNGVNVALDAQAVPADVLLQNVLADNAGGKGVHLFLDKVRGASSVTLDHVIATQAGSDDGLELRMLNMIASDSAAVSITNGSNFNGAVGKGLDIQFGGVVGTQASLTVESLSANDAGNHGIDIQLTGGVTLSVDQLDNVSATNAGGRGLNLAVLGDNRLTQLHSEFANFSGADGHGVFVQIDQQDVATDIRFHNLTASNTGGKGVAIDLNAVAGASTVELVNVIATGAGQEGLDFDAVNMAATDSLSLLLSGDFSNAGDDAVNLNFDGHDDATATLTINGLTANGAGRDGVDVQVQGVDVTVPAFSGVLANGNSEHGMSFDVLNGGQFLMTSLGQNIQASGNGTTGAGFDGIDVLVRDAGSVAEMGFGNLTANANGGRGVDLDVHSNGVLAFDIITGQIENSGLSGLDIDVGLRDEFGADPNPVLHGAGFFSGVFQNLSILNSGQFPTATADGVNVLVNGDGLAGGSVASVLFDRVISNASDEDGFDIRILNGAEADITVTNGTTANENAVRGFNFQADGALTTASLTMTPGIFGTNVFNNNQNGAGLRVALSNGVTMDSLVVNASASGNAQDGIHILANDTSLKTINTFSLSGGLANNNVGNGLFIDFRNIVGVPGVADFSLSNVSFSGNGGDQVFARFREISTPMTLSMNNVTVSGLPGSGDGVELQLIDTLVDTFSVNGLRALNNGQRGLNVSVLEQTIDGTATSGIATGFITNSEFSGNGMAGARLVFGGDSSNDFDLFNNSAGTLGFHSNTGAGLEIEVQDNAVFTIAGVNSQDATAESFYNNRLSNNGSFGFVLTASEPSNANPASLGPQYTLDLGDPLRNPNILTGNHNAALAIIGQHDSVGTFSIQNALLTGTLTGGIAGFNGDGLAIRLTNNAVLTDFLVDGSLAGLNLNDNAGSGIAITAAGSSRFGTNSYLTVINTTITGNSLHGIDIQRNDNALFGPDMNSTQIVIGQQGAGNTFANNLQNGINIVNRNQPGSPAPLDLQIEDNTITNNLDGVLLHGIGNAQFTGQISDNRFTSHNRDGIRVRLENQAALGNPNIPAGPAFVMAGNQIQGDSGSRYGIYFDTNYSNENGLFGGTAFVYADIRDSLVQTDLFDVPNRTTITGHGQHGILIRDNSQFAGNPGSNPVNQNTYFVRGTDIQNNAVDGIHAEQGVNTDPGGPSQGGVRDSNNGFALLVGQMVNPNAVGNRDVMISGNGDDGIDMTLMDGDVNANFLRLNRVTLQDNGASGDGHNALGATVGHGLEVKVPQRGNSIDGGRLVADLELVDILFNAGHGMDFDVGSNRNGVVANVPMHGLISSNNGERGLNAFLHHDRSTGNSVGQNSSVWNVGTAENFGNALAWNAQKNYFNSNGREGMVFDLRADNIATSTVSVSNGSQSDINPDVFVETNLGAFTPTGNPRQVFSTNHPTLASQDSRPDTGTRQETSVHMYARVNVINNEITNNGGLQGFEDGADFAVSSLTKMDLMIAGNTFGGNVGEDIRVYPQRPTNAAGENLNPPNSVNNNPATEVNSLPQNYIVYDPVAYIDVAMGVFDSSISRLDPYGDGDLDVGGADAGNTGNHFTIHLGGTPQTTQITTDGVYNNSNDPFKNTNRSVAFAGRVLLDNGTGSNNVFIQNGVEQIVGGNTLFNVAIDGSFQGFTQFISGANTVDFGLVNGSGMPDEERFWL